MLRRSPSYIVWSKGRTRCGKCGKVVDVVPAPEAEPRPTYQSNNLSVSMKRKAKKAREKAAAQVVKQA